MGAERERENKRTGILDRRVVVVHHFFVHHHHRQCRFADASWAHNLCVEREGVKGKV